MPGRLSLSALRTRSARYGRRLAAPDVWRVPRTARKSGNHAGRTPGGYDPIVCSGNQAAGSGASGIIRAIDQLAAESRAAARGGSGAITPELAGRVAAVWAMMAALDPALTRLIGRYEARDC